jgi:predicted nucleotidyltransferase
MAEPFVYRFTKELPRDEITTGWERFEGLPLLATVIDEAAGRIRRFEQFLELPPRNQELLLDMAAFMIGSANHRAREPKGRKDNFWGLYIIGSRARGEHRPESDLDLLSVGTFHRNQGFIENHLGEINLVSDRDTVFEGFRVNVPEELPSEYNIGEINRKYLVRATPTEEGVLPVDISVVDLTSTGETLDSFKETPDLDSKKKSLPRIPLVEVSAAGDTRMLDW